MRPDTLTTLLSGALAGAPDRPAVTDRTVTLDWRGFNARVQGVAAHLSRLGVGPGDRIALWLPNGADYLALIFALARLSAIAIHVNTRFRAAEVGYLLRRSRASMLATRWGFGPVDFPAILGTVAEEDRAALRRVIGVEVPAGVSDILDLPVEPLQSEGEIPDRSAPDAPCLTYTTSGTTKGPKLVLHNQRSIAGHAADVMRRLGLDRPGAALLAAVPFCGTFGNAAAMAAVAGRAHIVCMEQFDAAIGDALIRKYGVTHLVGGDDMLGRLAEAAKGRPHTTLVFSGFAAFHPNAAESVAAADALGFRPRGLYGSSEAQALFAIAADESRLTAGGEPTSPAAEIAVRDPETGAPLPPGESGELCIRAPSLFAGYLEDEEATRRARTADGLFRSGDLGHAVGRGFVYEARLGDALRLGGFLVSPEEIEGFIQAWPGIEGVQVVAAEAGGRLVPVAFVHLESGAALDEGALLGACRDNLARFKVPARVIPLEAFPTVESANGIKIQKVKLREMAGAVLNAAMA